MQQQQTHQNPPKVPTKGGTPARRRTQRDTRASSRKSRAYLSENDMNDIGDASAELPQALDGSDPKTPQKPPSDAPAASSQAKPKPRGGKERPKQRISTSPKPVRNGRHTTPPNTVGSKISGSGAFAGSTFINASPAPSSLPIPSFLAKAMESPGATRDLSQHARSQEPSPPVTDSEAPTPLHDMPDSLNDTPARESPLELFFRADREEKARRANSANAVPTLSVPFSPTDEAQSPQSSGQTRSGASSKLGPPFVRRPVTQHRASAAGISAAELDGLPGGPMGPAFSTPYHERLRAARKNDKPNPPDHVLQQPQAPLQEARPAGPTLHKGNLAAADVLSPTQDRGQRLMKFLQLSSGHQAPGGQQNQPALAISSVQPAMASATMNTAGTDNDAEIRRMEDSLRNILKLGPALNPGAAAANPNHPS